MQTKCKRRVDPHGPERIAKWAFGVFAGKEQRLQQLLQHESRQAEAVDRHRPGNGEAVGPRGGTTLIHDGDQRQRDHQEGDGAGQGEGQSKFTGARECPARARFVAGLEAARQVGQQHNADGNADDAQR